MLGRQDHNLGLAGVIEQRVDMNEQRVGPALRRLSKCLDQFRLVAGLHGDDLDTEGLSGGFKYLCVGSIWILRVD